MWEQKLPSVSRFRPSSWDEPMLDDWLRALDESVAAAKTPPVLIAHSLGCLLVAIWQETTNQPVSGAFLVAVPDPNAHAYPPQASSFTRLPQATLRFPSLMVASANDPYASMSFAEERARVWGAELHRIGNAGHINGKSNLGVWPVGQALLEKLSLNAD
jgi:predicted alpha/beta hydrolase family esterase